MSDLKPCPFCGEHLKSDGPDSDYFTHSKSDCHFSEWELPCMSGDNLEAWNRRTAPPVQQDAVDAAMHKIIEAVRRDADPAFAHLLHELDAAISTMKGEGNG